jgi:hypothetical protein
MFRFTRKPSSGSHTQYLAKITHLVQCGYIEVVQTLSVLWLDSMTCEVCAVHCVSAYINTTQNRVALITNTLTQCTADTPHRSYYPAITLTSVRPLCIHIEPSV